MYYRHWRHRRVLENNGGCCTLTSTQDEGHQQNRNGHVCILVNDNPFSKTLYHLNQGLVLSRRFRTFSKRFNKVSNLVKE